MRRGVRLSVIAPAAVLIAFAAGCLRTPGPDGPTLPRVALDGPDAEVRDFRPHELAARVRTMPPGVERDYFAGASAVSSASRNERGGGPSDPPSAVGSKRPDATPAIGGQP